MILRLFWAAQIAEPTSADASAIRKGGATVLTVVRARGDRVVENPNIYHPEDRFRLFVTLPGKQWLSVEIVVFQDNRIYFPYDAEEDFPPGNNHPLPGAFHLTGDTPIDICLVAGRVLPDRARIRAAGKRALQRGTAYEGLVCKTLSPEGWAK